MIFLIMNLIGSALHGCSLGSMTTSLLFSLALAQPAEQPAEQEQVKKEKTTKSSNMNLENITPDLKKPTEEPSLIQLGVEKYQLKNGMTVLLHVDQRLPQVYHHLVIKTGSKDEQEGKTGLAHLFEHMMFKGTKKYTKKEYEEKIESMGARDNAWTTQDYTAYHVTLPSYKLNTILQMEAERMNSLRLTQSNLDKEKEVVKEERRMRTDNNPNEFLEPLMKLIFPNHPYGRPVIGWMKDLETLSLQDCQKFYQDHYAPNNAILTLAGNFDPEKAKKAIQKYYGALKPSQLKNPVLPKEPLLTQPRSVQIKRAIHAPTLVLAYRGPKAGEPGSYSLDVLNQALVRGESSRLQRLLVYQKKLALSVGGFYYPLLEEGLFIIVVAMAPQRDLEQAKKWVLAEIDKVLINSISEKERLKSVRATMNDYISAVKTLEGKANALAHNEAYFKDYKQLFRSLDQYQKVTAKTIREEAKLYLDPNKVSVVRLLPEKG